jgi:hypothetical protein
VRRWEDNIKMDLRVVGYDRKWMELAQDHVKWQYLVLGMLNIWDILP